MLVGAVDCDSILLVHQSGCICCRQLRGNACRYTNVDNNVSAIGLLSLGICDVLVVSNYVGSLAISLSQLSELVDEAKTSVDNGLGSSILSYNTNTNRSGCVSYLILNCLINLLCCQSACCVVVSRAVCKYGSFRSTRNTRVKSDYRNVAVHSLLKQILNGLCIQSCQTNCCRVSVQSTLKLLNLLRNVGLTVRTYKVNSNSELCSLLLNTLLNCLPVLMLQTLGNDLERHSACVSCRSCCIVCGLLSFCVRSCGCGGILGAAACGQSNYHRCCKNCCQYLLFHVKILLLLSSPYWILFYMNCSPQYTSLYNFEFPLLI